MRSTMQSSLKRGTMPPLRKPTKNNAIMQNVPDIAECIEQNLNRYFHDLEGETASGVYDMVLFQVEKPMLSYVMAHCGGNQSKAAQILGLNRNTLRKKLLEHGLLAAD